jgi:hypothetical protein
MVPKLIGDGITVDELGRIRISCSGIANIVQAVGPASE